MPPTPDRRHGDAVDEDDLLAHPPTTPSDYVITRASGVITVETWTRIGGNLQRSVDYTYSSDLLSQIDIKVFGVNGTSLLAHRREIFTRTAGIITSSAVTRVV